MSNWEYKAISSGRGGFATPALLEKFLNDLGREEWEIIEFRTLPDNPLAFTGLARRSTQRDWTLEDAAAAAAKAEAEKLRAEFEAKFKAATSNAPATEEKAASFIAETAAPADDFRKPIDTSRDSDPDAADDEGEKDEWDQLAKEDELPTFFDALKPHMRRNQRGPGQSVGIDYLAKKWDLAEEDIKGALVECGLQIPADENAKPVHVEYDGDLYWVNINRRGEMWINTREKPRPVFRVVQAQRVADEEKPEAQPAETSEPKPESARHRQPHAERTSEPAGDTPEQKPDDAAPAVPGAPLPTGPALLEKIRPMMRRNRRGPGGSGSASFLSRALKCQEADLLAGFATLGLTLSDNPNDKPVNVEIGGHIWWLNKDSRGGVWINGREKRDGEAARPAETAAPASSEAPAVPVSTSTDTPATGSGAETPAQPAPAETAATPTAPAAAESTEPAPTPAQPASEAAPAPAEASVAPSPSPLAAVRLLLKETRTGSVAAKVGIVAQELGKSTEELLAALTAAGLKIPEKPREKPVFVELGAESLWLNRNSRDELWINAKASKFAGEDEGDEAGGEAKPRRSRSRRKSDEPDSPAAPAPTE